MNRREQIEQIANHLQHGDHEWFDVEAMRHGRDADWLRLVDKATESCAMTVGGVAKQYIPVYLPMIIHATDGVCLSVEPSLIGDALAQCTPPGYSLFVFPNVKSLRATLELDPVSAHGLSKEMAVSIYEDDGLEGMLPFDHETDVRTDHETAVLEGVLLACLVRDGVKEVPKISVPNHVLGEIADLLAKNMTMKQGTKPVVHIGVPSTRSNLFENTLLMKAFCQLKLLAAKGYGRVELEFTHADPSGMRLHYVARRADGKAVSEINLPERRLADFINHCAHLERHANIRCSFHKNQLS